MPDRPYSHSVFSQVRLRSLYKWPAYKLLSRNHNHTHRNYSLVWRSSWLEILSRLRLWLCRVCIALLRICRKVNLYTLISWQAGEAIISPGSMLKKAHPQQPYCTHTESYYAFYCDNGYRNISVSSYSRPSLCAASESWCSTPQDAAPC